MALFTIISSTSIMDECTYAQVWHPLIYCLLLPCPQIVAARIMTSHLCCLVRAISEKKARAYYSHSNEDFKIILTLWSILWTHNNDAETRRLSWWSAHMNSQEEVIIPEYDTWPFGRFEGVTQTFWNDPRRHVHFSPGKFKDTCWNRGGF